MTCYMRHLTWLFEAAGLPYDQVNRKRVDRALREILSIEPGALCPEVWSAIKALPPARREGLAPEVRAVLVAADGAAGEPA